MQVLLDTHLYIWWLKDDKQLTKRARSIIIDADVVYVSSASIWEAAIKIQLGKLDVSIRDLVEAIENEGFVELPLNARQAAVIVTLPNYHRDPFDRILVAQAISEPLKLLTADKNLKKYSELVELV